jgi:hypothetical protein
MKGAGGYPSGTPWSGLIISNCGIHPYCVMLKLIPCGPPLLWYVKIYSLGSTLGGGLIVVGGFMMLKFLKPTAKNQFQRRMPTYIYYLLTHLARCECVLTGCEPDGELTCGELTLACQPVTGLGRTGRSWPPAAPLGKGQSSPDSAGQRAGSAGQTPGSSLTLGGRDAKGIEQCMRASPLEEELVAPASWNSFA